MQIVASTPLLTNPSPLCTSVTPHSQWFTVKIQGWVYALFFDIFLFTITSKKEREKFETVYPGLICLPENDIEAKEADEIMKLGYAAEDGGER